MARRVAKLSLLASLLYGTLSFASAGWQAEPTAVLGIELGAPISIHTPICPRIDYRNYRPRQEFCREDDPYTEGSLAIVRFDKIPMGNILSTVSAHTYDGVVGSVHANSPHSNYQQFRGVLIERYGQPTSIETKNVRTKAGVDWTSEVLTWTGNTVSIQLHERHETVNASTMVVDHLPTMAAQEGERANAIKRAASEL